MAKFVHSKYFAVGIHTLDIVALTASVQSQPDCFPAAVAAWLFNDMSAKLKKMAEEFMAVQRQNSRIANKNRMQHLVQLGYSKNIA